QLIYMYIFFFYVFFFFSSRRRHTRSKRDWSSDVCYSDLDEKVVQRVLRHAKSHVTKERYIKAFDPAVRAAMRTREFFGRHESECTKSAPNKLGQCGKLLKPNRGEVAEWLNAAVC